MSTSALLNNIIDNCMGEIQAPCVAACPAHVNVPGFIKLLKNGENKKALELFREANPFPSICGRICHHPCELNCTRGHLDEPIAIKFLHRYIADSEKLEVSDLMNPAQKRKQGKIAIIGSGPAGLSCAYFLSKKGYEVVIYEKQKEVGGLLFLGIPEFRLPRKTIREEIHLIQDMGVELRTGVTVGKDISLDELRKQGIQAFFLAVGAQESKTIGIQGDTLSGVCSGIDFLREVNLGNSPFLGKRVAVIGGGNVALDAVRTLKRLGSDDAFVLYRRSLKEMPVTDQEIEECQEEGIRIETLVQPISIAEKNGNAKAIECIRMELGKKDESGRSRPIPIDGSEFVIEVDGIVSAVGQQPEWTCLGSDCACTLTEWGTMDVNKRTLQTDVPDIFAGGDAVTGPKTVVEAIEAGKQSAISIDRYIRGADLDSGRDTERPCIDMKPRINGTLHASRISMPIIPPELRINNFDEIKTGFNTEQAENEAERCLKCECRICVENCEFLKKHCSSPHELAEKLISGNFREFSKVIYSCNLCGMCRQVCPNDLDVGELSLKLREKLVEEGIGPLRGHNFVRKNQEYAISESFSYMFPDVNTNKSNKVFFPGCGLCGYSPFTTLETYQYLREKIPGIGVILGCCGAQTVHLGDKKTFKNILDGTVGMIKKMGTKEIIVACPECYSTFTEYAPELTLTFISDILLKVGLPEVIKGQRQVFSLHDSCSTRNEVELQKSIRLLVREMGYEIDEMEHSREKTKCCGLGGQAAFVDSKLVKTISENRAKESTFDLLTYCASCREALAAYKPTIHVLDLMFNPNWKEAIAKSPNTGKVRRENQSKVRYLLETLDSKNKMETDIT